MDEFQELPIEAPSEPSVADKSKDHAVDNIEEDTLDPYAEIQQGNLFPLIAGIKHIDLNYMLDENTPLLHHICKMHLPLDQLLKGRSIEYTKNKEGKTPLHFAIEAKDIQAVYWCLKHEK
jgi:ankyrin repeat protein